MNMKHWGPLLGFAVVAFAVGVRAETSRVIDRGRILVSDVVPSAPAEVGTIDLGPSPPPGGSRLVTGNDLRSGLQRAKLAPDLVVLEEPVRVVTAHRTLDPAELKILVSPAIAAALPRGFTVAEVAPSTTITTRPRAAVGRVSFPSLPRRAGQIRTTAVVELVDGDVVLSRVPVPVVLEVGEDVASPDVSRGTMIRVAITSGAVVVTTQGQLTDHANVGDVVQVVVTSTRRVVRAKLVSARLAEVIAP